jgi:plasmid maintenance system antidote protein VapI
MGTGLMPHTVDALIRENRNLVRAMVRSLECRLTGGDWWIPLEQALDIPANTVNPRPPIAMAQIRPLDSEEIRNLIADIMTLASTDIPRRRSTSFSE